MPKILTLKNFLGMNTVKRKLSPEQAREIQDMVSERGLTRTRPGFGKYNVLAQSGAILGIFDYRRKSGQKGFLIPDAYGDIYEWEQFHFGSWDFDWEGSDNFWWTVMYEANEMPDVAYPPWSMAGDDSISFVSEGILTLEGAPGAGLLYSQSDVLSSNSVGNIAEARLKGVSFGGENPLVSHFRLHMTDGTKMTYFFIYSNRVSLGSGESPFTYYMDTTDSFHTYKITSKGNQAKLFIDGIYRGQKEPANNVNNYIQFGDAGGVVKFQCDYIRYYTGGF